MVECQPLMTVYKGALFMSTMVDNKSFLINNLKALLQKKLWLLDERFKSKRMGTQYRSFTDAQARIFATLQGESLTISEVARRLDVSRQAVHKLVSGLVKDGLLALEPIPDNARDKRIVFTSEGESLKRLAAKALYEIEQEVQAAIGSKNLTLLKDLLEKEW